ncbi:MAG: hypothetical protein L0H94_05245 [Nitrospira sp.]|nr:hypothetical protein [Nitrospira sp.]
MQSQDKVRWDNFIATYTNRQVFEEWQDSLAHCEAWKARHSERALPQPVMEVLAYMCSAYRYVRPLLLDQSCWDQPAQPEMTNLILSLARKVRREVPAVEPLGHA